MRACSRREKNFIDVASFVNYYSYKQMEFFEKGFRVFSGREMRLCLYARFRINLD